MSERLKTFLEEISKELKEQKVSEIEGEPDFIFECEIYTTWSPYGIRLFDALSASDILGCYKGDNYSYSIEAIVATLPYIIRLKWWGSKNERLKELQNTIRRIVERINDVFWEDIRASEIKLQIQQIKNEQLQQLLEPLKKFFEFYRERLPLRIFRGISVEDMYHDTETNTLIVFVDKESIPHLIGRKGQRIKEFQQITGMRLKVMEKTL